MSQTFIRYLLVVLRRGFPAPGENRNTDRYIEEQRYTVPSDVRQTYLLNGELFYFCLKQAWVN